MRDLVMAALAVSAALFVAAEAAAQTPGDQAPGSTQSLGARSVVVPSLRTSPSAAAPARTAAPVPSTRVLGVPVTADAPVSPSYDGTAYKTLGGQAETDQDAISGQVMQPLDSGRPK